MPQKKSAEKKPPRSTVTLDSFHRILRILRVATSSLDPKLLFKNVVEAVHREFPRFYHVSVYLAFKGPRVFVPMAIAGEGPATYVDKYPSGYTQGIDQGILGQTYTSRRSYLTNDSVNDPHYICAVDPGTHSELCVPIKLEGDVVGILNLESKRRNAFVPEDVEFFEILADQLANAVHNSMVLDQLRTRGDQLSVLTSAASAAENTLRDIVDSLPAPFLKLDRRDRVAFANRAVKEALSAEARDIDGAHFLDFLDAASRARWEQVRGASPPARQEVRLALRLRDRALDCAWQAFPVHEGSPPLPFLLKRVE